ncbi:MAG: NADH-quinone oxidoreductase subunit NuoE [Melioribacteraceae bacterium]|nr:NADH-quinone oxidoreductase subunit NuoE [Melioribacteraceae bacterium]
MDKSIVNNYTANDRSSIIPLLQDIQDKFGYLPEQELQEASIHLGMPLSSIYGIATFYNQFRLTPLGKYVIRVCRGTACHVKGSAGILQALETELGIKAGCTTRDKLFTIETVACIGACSIAPVISVNDEYFGRLTVKEIPKIIKNFRNKSVKENIEIMETIGE